MNGYDDNASNYGDDTKGMGGFAGGDNKTRKRGVSATDTNHDLLTLTS